MKDRAMNKERARMTAPLPPGVCGGLSRISGKDGLAASLPDSAALESQAVMLSTISDRHRLKILYALAIIELCPCVLTDLMGLSNSRLSYHLKLLEKAGLISQHSDGNWRVYRLTKAGENMISEIKRLPEKDVL